MEGKKFSKGRGHDVLVLTFWLGALEFKILKYLFVCCLNIFLRYFPRFSVHKSLKILEKYIANVFRGFLFSQNKPNEFSRALTDLVPCVHLQFASLLEKQTSKKIYFFINPGKVLSATLEKRNDTYKHACSTDL